MMLWRIYPRMAVYVRFNLHPLSYLSTYPPTYLKGASHLFHRPIIIDKGGALILLLSDDAFRNHVTYVCMYVCMLDVSMYLCMFLRLVLSPPPLPSSHLPTYLPTYLPTNLPTHPNKQPSHQTCFLWCPWSCHVGG